jgi:thiol-disulfide isomerase/thioredoxin
MSKRIATLAALIIAWAAPVASSQELNVGDPAPKLDVKEFLKGDPVTRLEEGKTYVVEFWATWCGPCRASIPHLTELQKRHKDVTFIGVSVFERNQAGVKPFVDEMGEKMAYRVARDAVPDGGDSDDGAMAKSWMKAADEPGIPTAFIVNTEGKIAWIGHPMEMDKPLEKVTSGSYDLVAAAAERKAAKARMRKIQALFPRVARALQSDDGGGAVRKELDAAFEEDPGLEPILGVQKLQLLAKGGDRDKVVDYGRRLVDQVLKDSANGLNNLAWAIVDPDAPKKPDPKLVQVAVSAARRADELMGGKDAPIADTLAKALFDAGEVRKAVEVQERAVKLAAGTQFESDPSLKARLEQYKEAAKKAGDDK